MFAWGAVLLVTAIFTLVLLAMWREVRRPLDETDEYCASVDADLDARWPG